MLMLIAKETGDLYLKDEKLSLLHCIHYDINDENVTIGTFLSGFRHSGDEYFSFTINDENFSIKLERLSFSKNHYQVYRDEYVAYIGNITHLNWSWLHKHFGTLHLINGDTFYFNELFGIIAALQHNRKRFELRSNSGAVTYVGEFGIDDGFYATFTGSIALEGKLQMETVLSGLFFLDKKFRKWINEHII